MYAQEFDFNPNRGLSVEESYLQESVELMLIREQSRSDEREQKERALKNISAALERGTKGYELFASLEYLALEGTINRRINQRSVNYPDIRSKAAFYLGVLGGVEAKNVLIRMAGVEKDVTILIEVFKSLKKIGINDNNETLNAITQVLNRFNIFNSDNLLALSGIEAYEFFAEQNNWRLGTAEREMIFQISEGRYHSLIRQRAKNLLTLLRTRPVSLNTLRAFLQLANC